MNSSKTLTVSLLLLWAINAHYTAAGIDIKKSVLDVFGIFNGNFNNFDQDKEECGNSIKLEIRMVPVYLHNIQEEPMIYFEEALNGVILRMWVCTVVQLPNSNIIKATYYNFTDISQYKPGTFNTDELANLTSKDMHSNEGCVGYYKQILPGVFYGDVMSCIDNVHEERLLYSVIGTCYDFWVQPPVPAADTTSRLRVHLKLKNQRYKVTGGPNDYIGPCEKCE